VPACARSKKQRKNIMSAEKLATALQIARVLNYSKQNVFKRLKHVPADGELRHGRNTAKAWKLESLPKEMFDRLSEIRDAEGYRSIAHLLREPPLRTLRERASMHRPISMARERRLEVLEATLEKYRDIPALTVKDRVYVWMKVCDELDLQILDGANEKKVKRSILKVLLAYGLLGCHKETIRRNFNRQWDTYRSNGGKLVDRRTRRLQRKQLCEEDRNRLIARSLDCGGRESQAFRELRENGELTTGTLSNTISNPRQKSYVPASIRREITPEVNRLLRLHRSKREFELAGPYVPQDYTAIAAGQIMQFDDVTLPVYYWGNDPESRSGFFFGRGQWILAIDVRSRMVLGHALHSATNYNMRIVRSLLLRVHDICGLPEVLLLERGIWKTAKIIKGDELDISQTEQGLREFGIKFRHRKRACGKVIENVIGLLQNQMERVTGYAGRDERHDRFERVQENILGVNSGREHPSKYFLSKAEWLGRLDEIIRRYNHEPQEGNLHASPRDVWNATLLEQGTVHLGEKARFLLAHHKKPIKVQPWGIRLPPSLGGGLYYNNVTGRFAGQRMLAWINPDDLEAITLTSLDMRDGPYVVDRADALSPIGASAEELARAEAQIGAHNAYTRTQYRVIQDQLVSTRFRRLCVDRATVELGEKIEAQTSAAKADRQRKHRAVRDAQHLVRGQHLNIRVDTKNAERAAASAELVRAAYQVPGQ
jgi:hypothetical protein